MKIFLFVLAATILESCGDAIVRIGLNGHDHSNAARGLYFLLGAILLLGYGTTLNLAPVSFARVTGIYVATLFPIFQLTNYIFFRTVPSAGVVVGGALIVAGGIIVTVWQ